MSVDIVTKEDLIEFRHQLLNDLKVLLQQPTQSSAEDIKGLKTADVRRILGCSVNKLVSLRVSKSVRTKKIQGTLYYNKEDVKRLLVDGFD